MGFLHVVDLNTETPGDKLRKVNSFLTYFKERCQSLYQPRQNLGIDERMVIQQIQQYNRNKPNKWGMKLWVLVDSSNG